MAMSLSAFPNSLSLQRVSSLPSTSYGVSGRRSSNISVRRIQAQKQEGGGGGQDRDEVSDLESALGIENRTVRNVSADKKAPARRRKSMLDAIEEQMRVDDANKPPENKFFQTIRTIGDWLIDKTENSNGQDGIVFFAFAVFPVWCFALLVTSGIIVLPFDLPFLRELSKHIAETQ